jgi:hypothetical protein
MVIAFSCQKLIDKKKKQLMIDVITGSDWYVEQYFEDSVNITSEFLNYTFRFNKDYTVTGTLDTEVSTGTWEASIPDETITSQFPTATDPVKKLNGVWKITDSYIDYVEAERSTTSGKNILHLRKKE